jgi:hypothetical protein
VTHYVDVNSTNARPPFKNWFTAATNIQDAVDVAAAGDEIVVTNGIYATGGRAVGTNLLVNRLAVDKPLTVRSVSGPDVTVIDGAGTGRCAYAGESALLSGFTLTNGNAGPGNGTLGGGVFGERLGVVTNCIFRGNWAGAGGGAYGGTLYNCTLSGNSGYYGAGACGSILYGCTLTDNSAQPVFYGANGGGVNASTLYNCTLTGNSCAGGGGGACSSTLYNCTLTGNTAEIGGGASSSTLYNCTLTSNTAGTGATGGIGGGVDASTLYNCTLTGNSAISWCGGASESALYNCIVYFNQSSLGANYLFGDMNGNYDSRLYYCCTTPLPSNGVGNIDTDPRLASATHLSAASPCIGAGSPLYASGVDIDGEPWANPPCIGADQLVPGSSAGPLAMHIETTFTNVAVGFVVKFIAQNEGPILSSVWDFGDGIILTNQPFTSHAWNVPGLHTVRLTGYNDSAPGGVSAVVQVQVADSVYYVNQANAAPVFPFTNWASAATNIQDAIEAATTVGRLVLVTNGVYRTGEVVIEGAMTNRVALTNLLLQSVNGPAVTVIDGAGAVRCAYVGAGGFLNGFTLTNGKADNGGGVFCERYGVVTNCTLTGNSAFAGGGAFGGPYGGPLSGGTLYNCVLTGNSASAEGGGAFEVTLKDCMLSGNSADMGAGASSSTLNNCSLSSNIAIRLGGGAFGATLNNCTLTGNQAAGTNSWEGGGGAYDGSLYNCTLTGNSAALGGGENNSTLDNCIVYFNIAPKAANCYDYSGWGVMNHCCTTPMPTNGVGNITNAPLFVDYAGGNLHLQSNSPCINAGFNAYAPGPTDLDGLPRIVSGTVDIGAYEFQGPGSVISYAWLQQYGLPIDGSADFTDPDRDGMNNWQEWRCLTDPTNALSVLRLLSAAPIGTNVTVSWQSVAGVNYSLERATNLSSASLFTPLATDIPGQPGTITYTDTNAAALAPLFYRVGVGQ